MVVIVSSSFPHAVRRNKINTMFNVFIVVVFKKPAPSMSKTLEAGGNLVDDKSNRLVFVNAVGGFEVYFFNRPRIIIVYMI